MPMSVVADVFGIIQEYCSWSNDLFCPEDEVVYLLRGYKNDFTMLETMMAIERHYATEFVYENIMLMKDLIGAIACKFEAEV